MGYKIEYLKWFECYGQAMQLIGTLYSDLNSMVEIEQAICNSSAIQSESVDALKSYIKDVQWGSFLNTIMNMCSEANRIMSSYITGLQNFDASVDAVIDEEYLMGLEEMLKTLDIELSDFTDSMEAKAKSVSHIVSLPSKTSENISTGIEAMAKEVARVRHDFTDYEERKTQEFESFNELMNEFVRAGLYHVEAMPDVLNYSRTNAMIDPLKGMQEHYNRYREEVHYSEEQAVNDIQAMQDLMAVYENYRKSEEQMKYAFNTVVAVASFFVPFGSGYGVAFFTLSRITSAASVYYNLDKAVEAYDASVLVDTWDVEREAQGLTDFTEGSRAEAVYEIAGNLATLYTGAVVSEYAMEKMFSLADYDIELLPKKTAVPEVEIPKRNSVSAFGEVSEGDPEKYLEFQMRGSREGLKPEELKGISRVDEKIAIDKINYDDVLEVRKKSCEKSIKGSKKTDGRTFKSQYDISIDDKGYTKSSLEFGKKVHKEYKVGDCCLAH